MGDIKFIEIEYIYSQCLYPTLRVMLWSTINTKFEERLFSHLRQLVVFAELLLWAHNVLLGIIDYAFCIQFQCLEQ